MPPLPTSVSLALGRAGAARKAPGPVWAGPSGGGPEGGITCSLLRHFLRCRERFRVLVVDGLKPREGFDHKLFYGNLWHECERALSAAPPGRSPQWERALADYARRAARDFPTARQQIEHWAMTCRTQFPLYVDFWRHHPDVEDRQPVWQEKVFDVDYPLPSGRTVRLRGKWDAVDMVGSVRGQYEVPIVWLQENKTKADVREGRLRRQLRMDLQTMLYVTALKVWGDHRHEYQLVDRDVESEEATVAAHPIGGVLYNVVRRPFGGGKGSIVRHKPTKKNPLGESADSFYGRLRAIIEADPGYFFLRLQVGVTPADVGRFRRRCLDPILEQLCDWWEWVTSPSAVPDPFSHDVERNVERAAITFGKSGDPNLMGAIASLPRPCHYQFPFGVLNTVDEAFGSADVDDYLETGNAVGLCRVKTLFPELQEEGSQP